MPECGFVIFQECDGTNCPTPCSARMYEPPAETLRTIALLKLAVIIPLFAAIALLALACVGQGIENWHNTIVAQRES